MAQGQTLKPGTDVTALMSGQDVTALMTPTPAHEPAQPTARDAFRSGLTKFMDAVVEQVNPLPMLKQLYDDTAAHPIAALSGPLFQAVMLSKHVGEAQLEELKAAKAAYDKGDTKEAIKRTIAGGIPMLGPVGRQIGEEAAAGEWAKAGGHAIGVIAPMLAGEAAPAAVKGIARSPVGRTVAGVAEAAADTLESRAVTKFVKATSPRGTSKTNLRLQSQMRQVAGDILREPELGAFTRGGLLDKLEAGRVSAGEMIDEALGTVDQTKMHPTAPIVAKLRGEIQRLQAQTSDGRGGVTPATRADRVSALKKAIDEIQTLGPQANYQNLAILRQAWDEGGQMTRTPSVAADFQQKVGQGQGWASAADVLREDLARVSPEVAKANAEYHIYKSARDVVKAAEEGASVRPTTGRKMLAAGLGAASGAGPVSKLWGAVTGLALESASRSGLTMQVGVARLMTQLSDALRAGETGQAQSLAYRLAQTTGTTAQMVAPLRAIFGGMDPVPAHATAEKK